MKYDVFSAGAHAKTKTHYGAAIRCDNKTYLPSAGCVMPSYRPTYKQHMNPSILGHQTASHMDYAQVWLSGSPGNPSGGRPLTRHYWAGAKNMNRREALRICRAQGITRGCDEYPFASTTKGASTDRVQSRRWTSRTTASKAV